MTASAIPTPAGRRLRHARHVALAWALALASPFAAADCTNMPKPLAPLPHAVTCAGHSSCLATDTLTVTPAAAAVSAPIDRVCFRLAGKPTLMDGDVHASADDKPVPVTVALLPLLTRQLAEEASSASAGTALTDALRGATTGTLPLDVLVQDKKNGAEIVPVDIDTGELWRTRRMNLKIEGATCAATACSLGSHLAVTARGLEPWRVATKKDLSRITLLVDGVRLPGLQTMLGANDHELVFILSRDVAKPDSSKAWEALLQQRDAHPQTGMSIELSDEDGVISNQYASTAVIDLGSKGAFATLLVLVAGLMLLVAWRSSRLVAIRDDAPKDALTDTMPFSLGRSQMLLWTITVVAAWVFVGLTLGDWSGPNSTALILMGISAGTSVGAAAAAQDAPRLAPADAASFDALVAADATLQKDPKNVAAIEDRSVAVVQLRKAGVWTKGFFADITSPCGSDKSALHRLQMVAFTAVVWMYYVVRFYHTRAMPDLTDSQLALLGISGGTYVGYKFVSETKDTPPTP